MTISLILALLIAADAPVQASETPVAAESAPALSVAEKPVCRRVAEIGSHIRAKRVCMSRQQWDEQREQNRQMIDRAQMRRSGCGGGGGC